MRSVQTVGIRTRTIRSLLPRRLNGWNSLNTSIGRGFMVFKFLGHLLKVLGRPNQTYRRRNGDSVWHFSTKCKYWPLRNFEEINESPQFGVCPLCTKTEEDAKTPSYTP